MFQRILKSAVEKIINWNHVNNNFVRSAPPLLYHHSSARSGKSELVCCASSLTSCVWLMFLLVSYWLWSDAPITEVTEAHYVYVCPPPPSSLRHCQALDSTARAAFPKSILFHYLAVEQKKKTLLPKNSLRAFHLHPCHSTSVSLPPLFSPQFKFVPLHIQTLTWSFYTSSTLHACQWTSSPWMDRAGGCGSDGGGGSAAEICCSNWVKQLRQWCCCKRRTEGLLSAVQSYLLSKHVWHGRNLQISCGRYLNDLVSLTAHTYFRKMKTAVGFVSLTGLWRHNFTVKENKSRFESNYKKIKTQDTLGW